MIIWSLKKLIVIVRHSILLSFLFYVSTCLSLFMFALFYNWYLPRASYQQNVDLEIQNSLYSINNRDYMTKELVGAAYLFDGTSESLQANQEYAISLILDLPESDINFDIGMFGISVDAYDIDGRTSSTFKTMGTLLYKSKLLRYMTTLIYFPYYLFGRYEQKQTLNIMLRESYVDNPYIPVSKFVIRIHEKIQFYSVKLVVQAKFSGLKYMLHHWFYVTSFVLSALVTSFVFLFLLTLFYGPKKVFASTPESGPSAKSFEHELVKLKSNLIRRDLDYSYDYYKEKLNKSSSSLKSLNDSTLSIDERKNNFLLYKNEQ